MENIIFNHQHSDYQAPVTWPRAAPHVSSLNRHNRCEKLNIAYAAPFISENRIVAAKQAANAIQMKGCGITLLNDLTCEGIHWEQYESVTDFEPVLSRLLNRSERNKLSFIVRPYPPDGCSYAQLDDLDDEAIVKVQPISCLIIETSRGSYQAWILLDSTDINLVQRLKAGLDSDKRASGATRWPGTRNFKPKHKQMDDSYPIIKIVHSAPGLIIGRDEIDKLGLPPIVNSYTVDERQNNPAQPTNPIIAKRPGVQPRRWPRYDIALAGARKAKGQDGFDRSKADIRWSVTAYAWGWSVNTIAEKLLEVSEKAREKGLPYARRTAEQAARFVMSRAN